MEEVFFVAVHRYLAVEDRAALEQAGTSSGRACRPRKDRGEASSHA